MILSIPISVSFRSLDSLPEKQPPDRIFLCSRLDERPVLVLVSCCWRIARDPYLASMRTASKMDLESENEFRESTEREFIHVMV